MFRSQTEYVYLWAKHIKPVYRYTMTLGSITLLVMSWVFAILFPMLDAIAQNEHEANDIHKQVLSAINIERSCQALEGSIEDVRIAIQRYKGKQEVDPLKFVLGCAHNTHIYLDAYHAGQEKNKAWYTRSGARFDMHGTLPDVMQFLHTLHTSQKMIEGKQLLLTRAQGDTFSVSYDVRFTTIK